MSKCNYCGGMACFHFSKTLHTCENVKCWKHAYKVEFPDYELEGFITKKHVVKDD